MSTTVAPEGRPGDRPPLDAPAPPASGGKQLARPRLAEGIELIGEYEGSGFKEAPYIARRADGQVIQLTRLLHLVAEACDGTRDRRAIAQEVSSTFGRRVSAGNVEVLVERKLRPLGVLAEPDGSTRDVEKPDQLLALKFRTALVPDRLVGALTTVFRPLFFPPIVAVVLAALVALDVWLFAIHGIGQGVREAIYQPWLLLVFFGAVVLATLFHELGHASACRYGGAKPGVLGAGIYVVWPVFYCDVTDAYRLGKAGRLRTDLGGVYFNMIFALGTAGLYFATGFEPLLLIILLQHFAILQQLLPLLRLDGYYIVSDLTGVPDILNRIRPILTSLLPGREADERVRELKPWVRVVVTAYVVTLVPLLLAGVALLIISAPRIFATAYDSLGVLGDKLGAAFGDGEGLTVAASALQMAALLLPCLGIVATSSRIGRRVAGGLWGWTDGEPVRRAALGTVVALGVALAAVTWWPNGEYRPIQPAERATLASAVGAFADLPSGRPSLTEQRAEELGGAPTVRESGGDFREVPSPGAGEDGERPGGEEPADRESERERREEQEREERRDEERERREDEEEGTATAPEDSSTIPEGEGAPGDDPASGGATAPPATGGDVTPAPEAESPAEPAPQDPAAPAEPTTTTPPAP